MELLVGFWNKLCKDGERTQINYRKQDRIYRDRAYEILVMQPYSFLRVSPGEWSRDFGVRRSFNDVCIFSKIQNSVNILYKIFWTNNKFLSFHTCRDCAKKPKIFKPVPRARNFGALTGRQMIQHIDVNSSFSLFYWLNKRRHLYDS